MRHLPKTYKLDAASTATVNTRGADAGSPDRYEIHRDNQQNVIAVKLLNANIDEDPATGDCAYGTLTDVWASIAFYVGVKDIEAEYDNEPAWTDPRSASLRRRSSRLI